MPSSCEVQQSGKNCPRIVKIYTVGQVTHEQLQCTAGRVPDIWLQDKTSHVSRVFLNPDSGVKICYSHTLINEGKKP